MFQRAFPVGFDFKDEPKAEMNLVASGKARMRVKHLLERFNSPVMKRKS